MISAILVHLYGSNEMCALQKRIYRYCLFGLDFGYISQTVATW